MSDVIAPSAYICAGCGAYEEIELAKQQSFKHRGYRITRTVCGRCFYEVPCVEHVGGNHSEIWDKDDLKEDGHYPRQPMPEWAESLPSGQAGCCSACGHWMQWSVGSQRWEDHCEGPQEITNAEETPF